MSTKENITGLVSAIIPTYNYGKYVSEAIDSILEQRYEAIEIIIVDDGSTDNTAEALKAYSDKIHYIYQQNSGLSAATTFDTTSGYEIEPRVALSGGGSPTRNALARAVVENQQISKILYIRRWCRLFFCTNGNNHRP